MSTSAPVAGGQSLETEYEFRDLVAALRTQLTDISQSNQERDDATGAATVTPAPGLRLDLTLDNQNGADNQNSAGGGYGGWGYPGWGGYGYPGYGYPGYPGYGYPGAVAAVPGVYSPSSMAAPSPTSPPPVPSPTPAAAAVVPLPAGPPVVDQGGPSIPGPPVDSAAGTFFCMTKKTFMIVLLMLLVASVLAGLGYYVWRRKAAAAAGNLGGGSAANNTLGNLNLGLGVNRAR